MFTRLLVFGLALLCASLAWSSPAMGQGQAAAPESEGKGFLAGFKTQEARFGVGVVNENWSD